MKRTIRDERTWNIAKINLELTRVRAWRHIAVRRRKNNADMYLAGVEESGDKTLQHQATCERAFAEEGVAIYLHGTAAFLK